MPMQVELQSASVHKLLIHEPEIIRTATLPIGMFPKKHFNQNLFLLSHTFVKYILKPFNSCAYILFYILSKEFQYFCITIEKCVQIIEIIYLRLTRTQKKISVKILYINFIPLHLLNNNKNNRLFVCFTLQCCGRPNIPSSFWFEIQK